MKAKTIGYFKNVQNVGYCTANADMNVGMGVILDQATGVAKVPASEAEAQACYRIVTNINDKPEQHNYSDTLLVKKGEKVRADDLTSVANLEVEFAASEIDVAYDQLAVNDKLVFAVGGKLAKATGVLGYKVYFEIIKKTPYMGNGVLAVIRVQ